MNCNKYGTAIIFNCSFLIFVCLGSINMLAAQTVLSDTTNTNNTEVASNIDLDISLDLKKKMMTVVINNQNTGASCIGGDLFLYNNLGEKVYQSVVNSTSVGIDISKWLSGTYSVQFNFQNKSVKENIVID